MRSELWRIFRILSSPSGADGGAPASEFLFAVAPFPERPADRVARDISGRPAVLFAVSDPGTGRRTPALELENLRVIHQAQCVVRREGSQDELRHFTVVRCWSEDPTLQQYFLAAVGIVAAELSSNPSQAAVSAAIDQLATLFQAMSTPARKTVQGLWAELFVIRESADPVALVRAWHPDIVGTLDFADGSRRIEVKSSSSSARIHRFSLDQLRPIPDTVLVIASVIVKTAGVGASVQDLVDEIIELVPMDLHRKVYRVVADTLGTDWRHAQQDTFDREAARESVRFFDARRVPAPSHEVPAVVTGVRFNATLSGIEPFGRAELAALGGLLAATVPVAE